MLDLSQTAGPDWENNEGRKVGLVDNIRTVQPDPILKLGNQRRVYDGVETVGSDAGVNVR